MNDFVEECRREWRRLGVPDPVANEMAADLTADLDEAEAEGASPEDVLGISAFDPRRFAGSWAAARGVTGVSVQERPSWWRTPVRLASIVVFGALVAIAGLALLVGSGHASVAFASRRILGPRSIHIIPGGARRLLLPDPLGRFVGTQSFSFPLLALAVLVVIVSSVGLLTLRWWRRSGSRRFGRDKSEPTPSWN